MMSSHTRVMTIVLTTLAMAMALMVAAAAAVAVTVPAMETVATAVTVFRLASMTAPLTPARRLLLHPTRLNRVCTSLCSRMV